MTNRSLGERLLSVLLFAFLFVGLGKLVPDVYFQFFDKTIYYSIKNPVPVDRPVYTSCDTVVLKFERSAAINTSAKATIELVLTNTDSETEVQRFTKDLVLEPGTKTIYSNYWLPCDIPEGSYYYNGIVEFDVGSYKKETNFVTDRFIVSN